MPRYLFSSGTADVGVVAHAISLMVARGAGEVCVVDGLAQLVLDDGSPDIVPEVESGFPAWHGVQEVA